MSLAKSLLSLALATFVLGCGSGINVSSDYDPATDFSKLKTFRWMDVKKRAQDDPLKNQLIERRVRAAAEKAMIAKGFQKLDSGEPDFFVAAFAGLKEKMNVTDWGYSYGPYWGPYPYGRNIDVSYYTQASLFIDVIDNGKDQLLWRGVGTGVVRGDAPSPAEAQARMDDAVDEILYDFPPRPGQ
jgi:hypothetical protein